MGRRGGKRLSKMSHSVKKLLRREGEPGVVKAKKAKSRTPIHPGHRVVTVNAKRKAERDAEPEDRKKTYGVPSGTERRAEVRQALGKQARLEILARRRGIVPTAGGDDDDMGGSGAAPAPVDASDGSVAAASHAAKRALAYAPSNQRAFHKELSTVLKASDVLLEVLDARDPMGCRCVALEDAVMAKCRGKRVVLILNKVDLVPPAVTQRWLTYLRQYFPTLPFKASTQAKTFASSAQSGSVGKLGSYGTEAYGGDGLLQLLKNYSRSAGLKTAITVGIVGYPNVGKSSLINSLKRARAVNVGATPGVTTVAQSVSLDSKVKLMDCPGIIFARAVSEEEQADVLLRNCVRVEKLDDPTVPIEAILRRCPAEQLMEQYGVAHFGGALEFLTLVAAKRGLLRKGGAADHDGAARAVLQDWNAGRIRYFTEPPKPTGGVELVPHLASGFDWEAPARVVAAGAGSSSAGPDAAAAAGGEGMAAVEGAAGEATDGMLDEEEEAAADGQRLVHGWSQAHERGADKPKKAKRPPTKRAAAVDAFDDEKYNFQANRGIRKAQKAQQKKKRRAIAATMLLD
jgi:nuclear GTP-binding protein